MRCRVSHEESVRACVCLQRGSEHDALLLGRKGHIHPNVVPMSRDDRGGDDGKVRMTRMMIMMIEMIILLIMIMMMTITVRVLRRRKRGASYMLSLSSSRHVRYWHSSALKSCWSQCYAGTSECKNNAEERWNTQNSARESTKTRQYQRRELPAATRPSMQEYWSDLLL
jgi:hypothetical protein